MQMDRYLLKEFRYQFQTKEREDSRRKRSDLALIFAFPPPTSSLSSPALSPPLYSACGSYLSSSDYVVALAQPLWGNLNVKSPLCGHTITISANGKSTQATIMDACPTGGGNCGGPDLDMSQSLFEFFNPIGVGKFGIT